MTILLIGISPGGEYFVTRDEHGILRRHDRFLPGEPLEIGESTLQRMIVDVGLSEVNEEFDSPNDIEMRVNELLPRAPFDVHSKLSSATINAAPRVLSRWMEDPKRRLQVPEVVVKMLALPEVAGKPDIVQKLALLSLQAGEANARLTMVPSSRQHRVSSFFSGGLAA